MAISFIAGLDTTSHDRHSSRAPMPFAFAPRLPIRDIAMKKQEHRPPAP
jgi:hypothetical protein